MTFFFIYNAKYLGKLFCLLARSCTATLNLTPDCMTFDFNPLDILMMTVLVASS